MTKHDNRVMNLRTIFPFAIAIVFAPLGCERKTIVVPAPPAPPASPMVEPVAKTKTLELVDPATGVVESKYRVRPSLDDLLMDSAMDPDTGVVESLGDHNWRTFTARIAVARYKAEPSAENHAAAKKALADLDGLIAELEILVAKRTGEERDKAAAELETLQLYRPEAMRRFTAAQAKAPLSAQPSPDARTGAEKVEDAAKGVGRSIENAARKTGDAVKDAVRKQGND